MTGYKLRTHINKAIKSRSKACQRALRAYNIAAANLDPPHPQLEWSDIIEYTTLAEFEILRIAAREDIRNLEWANARNRQATVCHLKIKRAKEEIIRLNVEIKRVLTWINDENELFSSALEKTTDPLLYNVLVERALERERINDKLEVAVTRISLLKGFTGQISTGERLTIRVPGRNDGAEAGGKRLENVPGDEADSSDEETHNELDQIYEGMESLTIGDE